MPFASIQQLLHLIDGESRGQAAHTGFQMAYHARVAIDRIRSAIKQTEQFAPHADQMREVGLELVDAMDRLESTDHGFRGRLRVPRRLRTDHISNSRLNGKRTGSEYLRDV